MLQLVPWKYPSTVVMLVTCSKTRVVVVVVGGGGGGGDQGPEPRPRLHCSLILHPVF
jgi:hypothetical protein